MFPKRATSERAIDCFVEGLMPGVSLITVSLRRSMMLSIEAFHAKEFSDSPLGPIYTGTQYDARVEWG